MFFPPMVALVLVVGVDDGRTMRYKFGSNTAYHGDDWHTFSCVVEGDVSILVSM